MTTIMVTRKWSKKDREIVEELVNWLFDEVVKEDKTMKKFKEEALPVLMQSIDFRVWWDKNGE